MKVAETEQSEQMQILINTEEQDITLKVFVGETYNSITKAGYVAMIQK